MKGMALLKLSRVSHRFEPGDIRKAPKGTIPWLVDDGKTVPDTTFIQQPLKKSTGVNFIRGLRAQRKRPHGHLRRCARNTSIFVLFTSVG
jgi:hypothetical protein